MGNIRSHQETTLLVYLGRRGNWSNGTGSASDSRNHRETTSESLEITQEHPFRFAVAMVENGRNALSEPQMIGIYHETKWETP
jgi:hypothetical protein